MSPDRPAPLQLAAPPAPARDSTVIDAWPPHSHVNEASLGWLEVALPLWHRRWRLLASMLLCGALALGLALTRPLRYTGQASFVAQTVLRPSQSAVSGALPALAGLIGGGGSSQADLHVAILRSQAVADRIIDRFDLQRVWDLKLRSEVSARLNRRVSFGVGRREGVVQVSVDDDHPARAAAMANEYIEELRLKLRSFALEEARQRRQFYDAQLAQARSTLDQAQKKLQASGFDKAALRSEPRAAAEAYGRLQAEVTAAELRLSAARRVRAEASAEVQQALAEVAALKGQLARLELPKDDGPGAFVSRVREFRYAETLAESIARQAEAARVDEAADPVPLQVLDRATAPEFPSGPRLMLWLQAGLLAGLLGQGAWVLLRHRQALARQDPAYQRRLAQVQAVLAKRAK